MLSAKYTIKRSISLVIHGCTLQNEILQVKQLSCRESLIPCYMFRTGKSENALAIFLHGTDFIQLNIVYIPVKITAVQKLQQYYPYYCETR